MGYRYIAIGGMVPLKTADILATLRGIDSVRRSDAALHLLGVTRTDHVDAFSRYGVVSFDTTSPFRRAFKDGKDNYFTESRSYTALRVPQVEGNRALERLIRAGKVNQSEARQLERACLAAIRGFDKRRVALTDVLSVLLEYDHLYDGSRLDRLDRYRETLADRPWSRCRCDICKVVGVEVIIFRGAERNKRRGFHNLRVLHAQVHRQLARATPNKATRSR